MCRKLLRQDGARTELRSEAGSVGAVFRIATGKSLDSPQKKGMSTKCPKNVEKMSETCRPKLSRGPWKLKPGFINRVLVEVIFEASKCL